jgi:glutaredoxin
MKNLIYKNDLIYLSDEVGKNDGKTISVSGYNSTTLSNTNMPHQYFNKKIVIYGRHSCPYCLGALEFLKKTPTLYKKVIFVDIEGEPSKFFSKSNLLSILNSNEKTFKKEHTTVPMVFDNGVFVGGSTDSEKYFGKM